MWLEIIIIDLRRFYNYVYVCISFCGIIALKRKSWFWCCFFFNWWNDVINLLWSDLSRRKKRFSILSLIYGEYLLCTINQYFSLLCKSNKILYICSYISIKSEDEKKIVQKYPPMSSVASWGCVLLKGTWRKLIIIGSTMYIVFLYVFVK